LFESLNEQEQAFIQLNEIIKLRRRIEQRHSESSRLAALGSHGSTRSASGARNSLRNPRRLADATERQKQENLIVARLQDQYTVMRLQHHAMRAGVADAVNAWMEAAQELVEDFRSFKRFYPWDKYVRFLGYTKVSGDQSRTGATSLDVDLAAMADRLSNSKCRPTPHSCSYLIRCRAGNSQRRQGRHSRKLQRYIVCLMARYLPRICALSCKVRQTSGVI
jgi:general transcription factor 3C polypeptide 3 (transcription factor C subunit 4)